MTANNLVERYGAKSRRGSRGAFDENMKMRQTMLCTCVVLMVAGFAAAGTTNDSVYTKAKADSDLIVACTVLNEGPLGDGKSVQKSYQVKRDVIYWSVVGWKLAETFWIHFDSEEYSKEIQSGREASYHKGDQFIAFVDWRKEKKGWEFRIVRLNDVGKGDAIRKELKLTTEPAAALYTSP